MLSSLSIIEGAYFRDILSQPKALADTLASLDVSAPLVSLANRANNNKFVRVVLTGMGASFHALHPLNLKLVEHGLTPVMVETSELVHYESRFFDPRTLIVAVSQSGRSAEVLRLLKMNRRRSAVIAITNTPESPLASSADALVFTHAGEEFSVSCKTYVTALMALEWVGDNLCKRDSRRTRKDLQEVVPATISYLADWEDHVRALATKLEEIRHLFLVGRGTSMAAVGTGALIAKESARFHAEGMSSAAFRHGPLEMLCQEMFVLIFEGNKKTSTLNKRLLDDIQQQNGKSGMASMNAPQGVFRLPAAPKAVIPILEILPVQMITLALAGQGGREAGRFEFASKVTTTE